MEILEFDQLPRAMRPQLAEMPVLDGDPPQDFAYLSTARKVVPDCSDYFALYAVEDGQILSRVETAWPRFTTRDGTARVLAVCEVETRPTAGGRGIARRLLEELHRREAARGKGWAFLWTRRSWGAHRLYGALGYTDVYSPPASLKRIPRSKGLRLPRPYSWKKLSNGAVSRLEEILRVGTVGRLGFVPRASGSLRARVRMGWRSLDNYRVLRRGAERVGYAYAGADKPESITFSEVVVTSPDHHPAMIAALESAAAGRWLVLETTTFVADAEPVLEERGFVTHHTTHRTMMAKRLAGRPEGSDDVASTCRDPRFSNHRGDMF